MILAHDPRRSSDYQHSEPASELPRRLWVSGSAAGCDSGPSRAASTTSCRQLLSCSLFCVLPLFVQVSSWQSGKLIGRCRVSNDGAAEQQQRARPRVCCEVCPLLLWFVCTFVCPTYVCLWACSCPACVHVPDAIVCEFVFVYLCSTQVCSRSCCVCVRALFKSRLPCDARVFRVCVFLG